MKDAIIVHNLGKRYTRYHTDRPRTIMEAALSGLRRMQAVEHFWALQDISFTVSPGEMLGILGHNGAGKSTLLQLIGGVARPDAGRVTVNGRIGALLDLGAGFSPDLTGRENVFVTGIVAGLTRREVTQRFAEIVEFAELSDFIDNPVRTYSTGMQMRLAFSVAVYTNPEIMLVDEFLSVGDLAFQAKCLQRISELKAQGCAIVLISHSPEQIEELCDRALWLKKGKIIAYGKPEVVTGQYKSEMISQTQKLTPLQPPQFTKSGVELRVNENRFGSQEIEIIDVHILPQTEIKSGEALTISIDYQPHQTISAPIFGVTISSEDGKTCLDTNTEAMNLTLPEISTKGQIKLHLERLDLNGGKYFIDVGIYEPKWAYAYDYHWRVYPLFINSSSSKKGFLNPPQHWELSPSLIQT